jgi:hypothetical protein
VTLPERAPESWPSITDTRGFDCTSPDGDVAFLVSASGYGDLPADNVVVWVDGESATVHPVEDGWGFAAAADGASGFLLSGEHGTLVERITLADGTTQPFAVLPAGLGGRDVAVDEVTGRLAVIATTNPTLAARGDFKAPDDRLVVLGSDGELLSTVTLPAPRIVHSIDWLDADHVLVVWSLPTALVEVIALDGTIQSSTAVTTESIAVAGEHLYAATEDGVESMTLDGGQRRLLAPTIARVHDVVAVPSGPLAIPQPTPTLPATPVSRPEPSTRPMSCCNADQPPDRPPDRRATPVASGTERRNRTTQSSTRRPVQNGIDVRDRMVCAALADSNS